MKTLVCRQIGNHGTDYAITLYVKEAEGQTKTFIAEKNKKGKFDLCFGHGANKKVLDQNITLTLCKRYSKIYYEFAR